MDECTAGIGMFAKTPYTSSGPGEQDAAKRKADCSETTSQIHHSMLPFELASQRHKGVRERKQVQRERRGLREAHQLRLWEKHAQSWQAADRPGPLFVNEKAERLRSQSDWAIPGCHRVKNSTPGALDFNVPLLSDATVGTWTHRFS